MGDNLSTFQDLDTLIELSYASLLINNRYSLPRSNVPSFDDSSHPGDIFHLDYQHGRPAYLMSLSAVLLSLLIFLPVLG